MPIQRDIHLTCPNCKTQNQYEEDEKGDIYCSHCGLIITTSYPYVAGNRVKTLNDIIIDERYLKYLNYLKRKEKQREGLTI